MYFLLFLLPIFLFSSEWAESTLARMTLEEKIGQLFMAPACPLRKIDHWADWLKIMKDCHIGNAIVKQSDAISQVKFLNRLQDESKLPLLVSADAEWGLAMRMPDTIAFPRNMTLGAVQNIDLIEQMGREIGRQSKLVGIHINLAPVADVNNNPANPVIHMRSFGEDPEAVADRVVAFTRGLQGAGVMACVKHFPGHGDTNIDSHRGLPVINHSLERLEEIELVPFRRAIKEGVKALMTAHLYVPALDPLYPTSLSKSCLELVQFDGLIISDALNMKAVADRYSPEEIAILARRAGCDILLYGDHKHPNIDLIMRDTIPRAFQALKGAYESGELSMEELDRSVLKILCAKEGIEKNVPLGNLMQALHTQEAYDLKKQLFEEAVTLIGEDVFPLEGAKYISIGENDVLASEFEEGEPIVIAVHQKEALTDEVLRKIGAFSDRAILCLFISPYTLNRFENFKTVLVGYENDPNAQYALLDVLKGKKRARGRLPVTVNGP